MRGEEESCQNKVTREPTGKFKRPEKQRKGRPRKGRAGLSHRSHNKDSVRVLQVSAARGAFSTTTRAVELHRLHAMKGRGGGEMTERKEEEHMALARNTHCSFPRRAPAIHPRQPHSPPPEDQRQPTAMSHGLIASKPHNLTPSHPRPLISSLKDQNARQRECEGFKPRLTYERL